MLLFFKPELVTGLQWLTYACTLCMLLFVCSMKDMRKISVFAMCVLCAFESGGNAYFILSQDDHVLDVVSSRENYVSAENTMLTEINARYDFQPFRIYTTRPWDDPDKNPSFATNQNEPLAFSFNGVTGYSSIANTNQLDFLGRMGENRAHVIASTKQPLLPLASLLSAKYIVSSETIPCLQNTGIVGPYQQFVYQNQYALPFMFAFDTTQDPAFDTANPFVYNNEVYSFLFNAPKDIFKEASVRTITKTPEKVEYELSLSNATNLLYGLLPNFTGEVLLNGAHYLDVKKDWVSTRVFYIPVSQNEIKVTLAILPQDANEEVDPIFQECQTNVLQECSELAKERAATIESFSDTEIQASVTCSQEERLFASIPVTKGWKVWVNGQEVEPTQVLDCFYAFPLNSGENSIKMTYTAPGLFAGRCATALGIVAFGCELAYERRHRLAR